MRVITKWATLGLVTALGLFVLLSSPVSAASDKYEWVNDTTIVGKPSGIRYIFVPYQKGFTAPGNSRPETPAHYAPDLPAGRSVEQNKGLAQKLVNVSADKASAEAIILVRCNTYGVAGQIQCETKNEQVSLDASPLYKCPDGTQRQGTTCVNVDEQNKRVYENLVDKYLKDIVDMTYGEYASEYCRTDRCTKEEFAKGNFTQAARVCLMTTAASTDGDAAEGTDYMVKGNEVFAKCLAEKYPSSLKNKESIIVKKLKRSSLSNIARQVRDGTTSLATAPTVSCNSPQVPSDDGKSCVEPSKKEEKSCSSEVKGIGWIVCPLISAAAGFGDLLWGMFDALMFTNPLEHGSVQKIWSDFRNIANALLVVAFLIVVFSQVSNIGISNYGIKKMLPKLIIVAIAINLSYVLLQISVDVANILGKTIVSTLDKVGIVALGDITWDKAILNVLALPAAGAGAIILGISVAGGIGPLLIFIGLLMLPAVLSFIAGLVTLMFRAAILPILAVLAPLAFVAYVFPNTQELFNKWRKMFTSLLFLYPLAALLYGGLKMGANIIAGTMGWFGPIVAVFILFFGAGAILILAIKSNSITGKALGTVQGLFNKAVAPVQKVGRDIADDRKLNFLYGRERRGIMGRIQRTRRGFEDSRRRREGRSSAIAEIEKDRYIEELSRNPAGTLGEHLQATDAGQRRVREADEVEISRVQRDIQRSGVGLTAAQPNQPSMTRGFREAVMQGDRNTARAYMNTMLAQGGRGMEAFSNSVAQMERDGDLTGDMRAMAAEHLQTTHESRLSSDFATRAWAQGTGTMDEARQEVLDTAEANSISLNDFTGQSSGSQLRYLNGIPDAIGSSTIRSLLDKTTIAGASIAEGSPVERRLIEIATERGIRTRTAQPGAGGS